MTNKEITSLALKVFAIYVLVKAILALPTIVNAISSYEFYKNDGIAAYTALSIGGITIITLLGISFAIWKLSNSVIKNTAPTLQASSWPNTTEEFILSALGIYLSFEGLLAVFYMMVSLHTQLHAQYTIPQEVSPETVALLVGNVVQVIVGVSLIIRARGWVIFLRKLREAGLDTKPSNN